MKRFLLFIIIGLTLLLVLGAATIGIFSHLTEREISAHIATIRQVAEKTSQSSLAATDDAAAFEALPAPVQRYLNFAVPDRTIRPHLVQLKASGDFRRPLQEGFEPTTAAQTIAVNSPALMFDATTPILPGLWARAYDFFAEGKMQMRAKIASTLTVVDENATEALNRTSLQRWLLESPLYPTALLPGGPVRWEAIDDTHARAIVSGFGLEASLVATFRPDGSLASFAAEKDGDLTTPYHGSGEHVTRDDYRLINGLMIPHLFQISRAKGGKLYPFWTGNITAIGFE